MELALEIHLNRIVEYRRHSYGEEPEKLRRFHAPRVLSARKHAADRHFHARFSVNA